MSLPKIFLFFFIHEAEVGTGVCIFLYPKKRSCSIQTCFICETAEPRITSCILGAEHITLMSKCCRSRMITHLLVNKGLFGFDWILVDLPDVIVDHHIPNYNNWLVVWNIFPYIGNNNPIWLSYFSEGWLNHQPDNIQTTIFGYTLIFGQNPAESHLSIIDSNWINWINSYLITILFMLRPGVRPVKNHHFSAFLLGIWGWLSHDSARLPYFEWLILDDPHL